MWTLLVLLLLPLSSPPPFSEGRESLDGGLESRMKNWTDTFGSAIFDFGNVATKYDEMQRRFQTSPDSSVENINIQKRVEDIVGDLAESFTKKVDAVRKMMVWAENKALEHFEKPEKLREKPPETFYNARKINTDSKRIDEYYKQFDATKYSPEQWEKEVQPFIDYNINITLDLREDDHFGTDVNLNCSIIHVPSSIWDKKKQIIDGVQWTAGMDEVFTSNYANNPTLYWQYFGSALGFFRQYPAIKWPNDNSKKNYPDLYDCRTRPWYTAAANSPKNIVILQDMSGSMTGLRKEISRHVVYTILDTLTENDYVSVLNFTDETYATVPCYNESLVQANLQNIRELKVGLQQGRTYSMANFTKALRIAYRILDKHRDLNRTDSANCNEAIMLITDGAPELYNEIFDERNKEMRGRTRVFTYLIGRDVTEATKVLSIACTNKGYFTHVKTLGEVQEQVLKYLAVMSRPMVLDNTHSISWTNVYADVSEVAESDWQWDEKNREEQGNRSKRYQEFLRKRTYIHNDNYTEGMEFYVIQTDDEEELPKPRRLMKGKYAFTKRLSDYMDYGLPNPTEEDVRELEDRRKRENQATQGNGRKYEYMVSVSLPVFDQRNMTEKEMPENETNTQNHQEEKIAIFLGVVGTDIPISEFRKIATPFRTGVNGYSFAVTENGHVLFHPDWRPTIAYTDVLRPNYNSVDLSEIELVDSDLFMRNLDPKLLEMRKDMLNIESGEEARVQNLQVRIPADGFKRVFIRKQKYAYAKIPNTTYTLAIALPESQQYEFSGELEIRRDRQERNVTHYFESPNEPRLWKVNPDWTYCEYIRGSHREFKNKEELILHFLREIQGANHSWPWKKTGTYSSQRKHLDTESYICDKKLVQSLVFDANVTGVFNLKWYDSYKREKGPLTKAYIRYNEEIMNPFGPIVGFIATRSGLTRWVNYTNSSTYKPFSKSDIRATEELWYKRAVERYELDRLSFIVSVPFDAGTRTDNEKIVTATRPIFVHRSVDRNDRSSVHSAPVAVAGVQFEHNKMAKKFWDITSKCDGCLKCQGGLDCYVLDDNGFIIIADRPKLYGRFFGEIHGEIMEQLVLQDIYKKVRVVDYQAVCLHLNSKSFGSVFQNPFSTFQWLITWFIGRLAWFALQINLHSFFAPDFTSVLAEYANVRMYQGEMITFDNKDDKTPFVEVTPINKTRLRLCHNEYFLYTYGRKYHSDLLYTRGYHPGLIQDCDPNGFYGVHIINRTNLIMIAIDSKCSTPRSKKTIAAHEVEYEVDEEIENNAESNDILNQICRIPTVNLDRKRPSAKCLFYNEEERELRQECGGTMGLQPSTTFIMLTIFTKFFI